MLRVLIHKSFALCFFLLLGSVASFPSVCIAEVKLHGLFNDHMVLQRDKPIQVWGTAEADEKEEKITVTLADQTVETTVKDGKWKATLKPLSAGGPHKLTVKGSNTITVEDVLIGEVWLCGGQSNMEFPIAACETPKKIIAAADHPKIRLITIPRPGERKRVGDAKPQSDIKANWAVCTPKSIPSFSAVAYHFGVALNKQLDVPIGLINSNVGGTPAEKWMSMESLKNGGDVVKPYAKAKDASTLYNSMIYPLAPFGIRGAIWYQGESNADKAHDYRTLFPAMIKNWRDTFGQGDFPFLFVQLAPFREKKSEPVESDWAELREAQLMTLSKLPNTAMAVITDIGNEKDIHPKPKQPVGERLAIAARGLVYGEKIETSGPIFESLKIDGKKAVLQFAHVGKGLELRGEKLTGFEIAGEDKKFHNATATIVDNTVVVESSDVAQPIAVRFGWADFPIVNLWNKDGLPASPFRTDKFPGITEPK